MWRNQVIKDLGVIGKASKDLAAAFMGSGSSTQASSDAGIQKGISKVASRSREWLPDVQEKGVDLDLIDICELFDVCRGENSFLDEFGYSVESIPSLF